MSKRIRLALAIATMGATACGAMSAQNPDVEGGDGGVDASVGATSSSSGGASGSTSGSGSGSSGSSGGHGSSSGSSSGSGSGGGSSGGSGSGSGSSSGSSSSSGSGSSSGVIDGGPIIYPTPANMVFAHGAPGLGVFRLCFSSSAGGAAASVAPFPALPDGPGASDGPSIPPTPGGVVPTALTPGYYPGTINAFPDPGTSLQGIALTPFVLDATKIANDVSYDGGSGTGPDGGNEENCQTLIGAHGSGPTDSPVAGRLQPGVDFWALPTIPAGTLLDGQTYLLSVIGCLPGYAPSAASVDAGVTATGTCGSTYDPTNGNLSLVVNQLSGAVSDAGMTVQFVNLSTALQGNPAPYGNAGAEHAPASEGVIPTLDNGGGPQPLFGATMAPSASGSPAVTTIGLGSASSASFGVITQPGSLADGGTSYTTYPGAQPDGGSTWVAGDLFSESLTHIQTLSSWQATTAVAPSGFANGAAFTFVLLGNNDVGVPQPWTIEGATNNAYDGRGLHFVAFPNSFQAPLIP